MRRLASACLLVLALAGCREQRLAGVYLGPAPAGRRPPGVTGTAAVRQPWLIFDAGGHVRRGPPRTVADLDVPAAARRGPEHAAPYTVRWGRLTIEWPGRRERRRIEVARDHLLLDGARWERVDGRAAGRRLAGRYEWSRQVPGIVAESSTVTFGADGAYRGESRTVQMTPAGEPPQTHRRTGRYRLEGDVLHVTLDDGTAFAVPLFVSRLDGDRVTGLWMGGQPYGRVGD